MVNLKRMSKLLFVSFIFVLLFSTVVSARVLLKEEVTGNQYIDAVLNTIFRLNASDAVTLKLIFSLLMFSILFGASQLLFKNHMTGVRIAVCAILSIITMVTIPPALLISIANMFGAFFVLFAVGIPTLIGFWIIFRALEGDDRFTHFVKFIICAIFFYVLGWFGTEWGDAGFATRAAKSLVAPLWATSIIEIVSGIYAVLMIYYVFKLFGTFKHGEEASILASQVWTDLRRMGQADWRLARDLGRKVNEISRKIDAIRERIVMYLQTLNNARKNPDLVPELQKIAANILPNMTEEEESIHNLDRDLATMEAWSTGLDAQISTELGKKAAVIALVNKQVKSVGDKNQIFAELKKYESELKSLQTWLVGTIQQIKNCRTERTTLEAKNTEVRTRFNNSLTALQGGDLTAAYKEGYEVWKILAEVKALIEHLGKSVKNAQDDIASQPSLVRDASQEAQRLIDAIKSKKKVGATTAP